MELNFLESQDWFDFGHGLQGGSFNDEKVWIPQYKKQYCVWSPPPAIAFEAMEELTRSRHMNCYALHIFVCTRLMTSDWQKSLLKRADTVFMSKLDLVNFGIITCMNHLLLL